MLVFSVFLPFMEYHNSSTCYDFHVVCGKGWRWPPWRPWPFHDIHGATKSPKMAKYHEFLCLFLWRYIICGICIEQRTFQWFQMLNSKLKASFSTQSLIYKYKVPTIRKVNSQVFVFERHLVNYVGISSGLETSARGNHLKKELIISYS